MNSYYIVETRSLGRIALSIVNTSLGPLGSVMFQAQAVEILNFKIIAL